MTGTDTSHRNEIAASVAAQQTLGPGYDQALAEGLVERIGEEIDKRISARIDEHLAADTSEAAGSHRGPHLECRHLRRARRRAERAERRAAGAGYPPLLLPLGSMVAGILASLTVLLSSESNVATNNGFTRSGPGAAAIMLTVIIWIVIGVINVAHVRGQR